MASPKVIIFGRKSDQVYEVIQLLPNNCLISLFSFDHHLREDDIYPEPDLVLIIPDDSGIYAIDFLKTIRGKLPHTPLLFIAEDPGKEEIIEAFRFGVTDYLLFPLQPEAFLRQSKGYINRKNRFTFRAFFKHWLTLIYRWLEKPKRLRPSLHVPNRIKPTLDYQSEVFSFAVPVPKKSLHELEVRFFGSLTIKIRGEILPALPGEKVNALLAYFLYYHKKSIHREKLLSKFWGYSDPSSARNSLNVATYNIRRHLNRFVPDLDFLQYHDGVYLVNPNLDIFTDTAQFLIHWKQGRAMELADGLDKALTDYQKAIYFYKGDFLENIQYEEWCETERDNLKETYLLILDRMGIHFIQEEAFRMAVTVFQKMLDKDICMEAVHRKLILCFYRLGQRDKAIKQYYLCVNALKKELNIDPSQPTRDLFQLIRAEKDVSLFMV